MTISVCLGARTQHRAMGNIYKRRTREDNIQEDRESESERERDTYINTANHRMRKKWEGSFRDASLSFQQDPIPVNLEQ